MGPSRCVVQWLCPLYRQPYWVRLSDVMAVRWWCLEDPAASEQSRPTGKPICHHYINGMHNTAMPSLMCAKANEQRLNCKINWKNILIKDHSPHPFFIFISSTFALCCHIAPPVISVYNLLQGLQALSLTCFHFKIFCLLFAFLHLHLWPSIVHVCSVSPSVYFGSQTSSWDQNFPPALKTPGVFVPVCQTFHLLGKWRLFYALIPHTHPFEPPPFCLFSSYSLLGRWLSCL